MVSYDDMICSAIVPLIFFASDHCLKVSSASANVVKIDIAGLRGRPDEATSYWRRCVHSEAGYVFREARRGKRDRRHCPKEPAPRYGFLGC